MSRPINLTKAKARILKASSKQKELSKTSSIVTSLDSGDDDSS
jgi:hypothetical protein